MKAWDYAIIAVGVIAAIVAYDYFTGKSLINSITSGSLTTS